ncbi:MAG: metallophosphoesterase [Oscillospiraceae bacterium]|nr:metallophosphoesterase [Oscillospiraceae bacterium]
MQISDLHNKKFGKNQQRLVKKIKSIKPNVIFITGNWQLNSYNPNTQNALNLINQIVKIAPNYFIPGNHKAKKWKLQKNPPQINSKWCSRIFQKFRI